MRINKKIISALVIFLFIIINSTTVFAITPHYTYNTAFLIVFYIMRITILIVLVTYIIFQVKYLKESNKKTKNSIFLLIITIVIVLGLFLVSNLILEAGKMYTSSLSIDFGLPTIINKNNN